MPQVVGVGAGGHAAVLLDILRFYPEYEVVGLTDARPETWGQSVLGVPVLGGDDLLPRLRAQGVHHAFVAVGSTRSTGMRARLFRVLKELGFSCINLVHPQATVAPSVEMREGVAVMAGAVVNPGARLGCNVIVNTGAIVEHHCRIGDHVHIAPGARLAAEVAVGEGSHIGIGATVLQGVRIGRGVTVGAGAVVLRDVPDQVTVVGVPARVLPKG